MRRDKVWDDICFEIHTETGIPLLVVHRICEFQFRMVKRVMESGKTLSIRIPLFGRFETTNRWRDKVNSLAKADPVKYEKKGQEIKYHNLLTKYEKEKKITERIESRKKEKEEKERLKEQENGAIQAGE